MKVNARITGADPSPFDEADFVDKRELEEEMRFVDSEMKYDREVVHRRIDGIEQKIKERTIIGGIIAAAIVFVMIMRKDE